MNDDGAEAGSDRTSGTDDELFRRLTDMLSPQHDPPRSVMDLAKQSFGLRTIDAELAALVADSQIQGTAAAVRRGAQAELPRLLTFRTPDLLVELELTGTAAGFRILGELVPGGAATIEVRQPQSVSQLFETDEDGRFLVEGLATGPFSLTCRRKDESPVTTEWTSLD